MSLRARKILFFVALPALLAVTVWQTRLETDLSTFFIAGASDEETFLANAVQSGELSRRYILSIGRKDGNNTRLPIFAERYWHTLKTLDDVDQVWDASTPPVDPMQLAHLYAPHYAQRYSLSPERDAPELFQTESLERRAKALKEALLSPQGRLVKAIALQDPMLLSLSSLKQWGRQIAMPRRIESPFFNLILESKPAAIDAPAQTRLQQAIEKRFQSLNDAENGEFTLEYTGIPVFAVEAQRQITGDIQTVSLVSSVGIIILFLVLFRSLWALHWVFAVLIASLTVATLLTQCLFDSVHGLTLALGATLLGVCIDYPIHTLAHGTAVDPSQRGNVIAAIWPSLLLGGITTVVGYTALGLSGYPGFRQIAVFAATGIVVALLLTRFVFPAFVIEHSGQWERRRFPGTWIDRCEHYRFLLIPVIITLALAALATLSQLSWLDDLEKLTGGLSELRERDRTIRQRLISIEPGRFILIDGSDTETALAISERTYGILDNLKRDGKLEDYFGPFPWLISDHLQQRNDRAFRAQLNAANVAAWHRALETQGLSVSRLGKLTPRTTVPLLSSTVLESQAEKLVASHLIETSAKTLVVIWLAEHQPEALSAALDDVPGVQYFSQRDMLNNLAGRYQDRAVTMLVAGLAAIFTLLVLRYKHPAPAMRALTPALLAALFILASFALTGHPVSFLHIVGLLLSVAICVDYGIFYLENRSHDRRLTYQAMGASMLTTLVAFGALSLAENPTLQALSAAVTLGVLIGFLLCPVVIGSSRPNTG